jgi:hypothetical protein
MCRLGRSLAENKRKRVFIDLSVVFHVSELKAKGGEKKDRMLHSLYPLQ